MTPLQKAVKALLDCPETACTRDNFCELHRALAAELQQAVEPYGWLAHGLSRVETGKHAEDNARSDARRMGYGSYAFPVYLHPPRQAKPKTMGDVQEMCIAALQRDERAKVGDSRFESWYSELNQAGKGSKQIAREAYEAGLNEADAQQAKRVPMTTDDLYAAYIAAADQMLRAQDERLVFAFARAIEAHHGIGGQP